MAVECRLRGLGQPPQPRPAGHQPECTGSRPEPLRRVIGPQRATRSRYQQSTRPYFSQFPNFGIINQINSAASSSYNALQVTLRSSSWHGLTSQFAYAWSHNLDDSSVFNTIPQNSLNLAGDWGNANQDIRNHFSAYLNYAIPALAHGPKALTHGWEVNSILKFQNGEPVNVLTGAGQQRHGRGRGPCQHHGPGPQQQPLGAARTPMRSTSTRTALPCRRLAPTAIWAATRSIGPGFGDVDLSLLKNMPIYKERVRAQFRVEMFNVFNRTNLAQPLN